MVNPGGRFVSENIKVSLVTYRGVLAVTFTDARGGFDFTDLTPGNYEVQVETSGLEYQIVNQNVQVFKGMPSVITVPLNDKNSSTATRAGSVSVAELSADVPKAAKKEFEAANKAAANNRSDEAIAHLRKAIEIYPGFVMARNNLGAQLLGQGKLDDAAEELQKAIELDQKAFNPKLNLGIVLVEQQRFIEAAIILDQALALNSESPSAQLYAGVARLRLENLDLAEKHLKAAYALGGVGYSMALFHLGELYMNKGDRQAALKSFQAYLHDSPSASNAAQVQKMIAMLH